MRDTMKAVAVALAIGTAFACVPGLVLGQEVAQRDRGARQVPDLTREVFMARAERAAVRRFERIDADGDGVLTQAERAADRQRRREAFQARQARAQ